MQLESVCVLSENILEEARRKLSKRVNSPETQIMAQLRGQEDQRLQCPFCMYESKSAIIRNGCFKCFACGKFGRLP